MTDTPSRRFDRLAPTVALLFGMVGLVAAPARAATATLRLDPMGKVVSQQPNCAVSGCCYDVGEDVAIEIDIDDATPDTNLTPNAGRFDDPTAVTRFIGLTSGCTNTLVGFGLALDDPTRIDPMTVFFPPFSGFYGVIPPSPAVADWDLFELTPPLSNADDLKSVLFELPRLTSARSQVDGFAVDFGGFAADSFEVVFDTQEKVCATGSKEGDPCTSYFDCSAGETYFHECRGVCVGGSNEGQACTSSAECPDFRYVEHACVNRLDPTITLVVGCGNGIVEGGEACDDLCCNDTCTGPRADGEVCRPAAGDCDASETCDGASTTCPSDALKAEGAPCGDPFSGPCDAPDTCNDAGVCLLNWVAADTICRDQAPECDPAPERCSGRAAPGGSDLRSLCPQECPNSQACGLPCGDPTDDACTGPDYCDQNDECQPNHAPAGDSCDADQNLCTTDQCDGSGTCVNVAGVICAPGSTCDGGEACNPDTGLCEDQPDAPDGTQCPDTDANVCSSAACDGGTCVQNFACAVDAPECRIAIGDFIWDDADGDGIQDGDEPGIENVVVNLVDGCTAPEEGGATIASTATAADGSYGFSVLGIDALTCEPVSRDLLVEVDASNLKAGGVLEGLTASPRFAGGDPALDSNCNVDSARTMCMAYSPGADQTIDCGFFEPFPICLEPRAPLPFGICQLPDGDTAYPSEVDSVQGAEHFTPATDFEITVLRWWGLYYDSTSSDDCSPGPGDAFRVTYYLDAGGAPGAVHAGPFPIAAADLQKCHTGELVVTGVDLREWQYEAPVPAVHFEAGVPYWVEIANDTSGDTCDWFWSSAPPGDDAAFLSVEGPITDDLAFCFNTIRRTCRSAGYYSTHSNDNKSGSRNVTQDLLDAAGCLEVCDEVIHTTAVDHADSAVEGLCVATQGTPERQLARQLIALGLNCIASGYGPECEGWQGVEQLFRDCNMECDAPELPWGITADECIAMVSCVNEGGDPFGAAGVCYTGTCSDNGQPCSARDRSRCGNPTLATCEDDLASCHAQDICNPGVGVCVEPGTSADPSNCKRAKASACTILEVGRTTESDCAQGLREPEEDCLLLEGGEFSPVTEDLTPCATVHDAWEFEVVAGETVVVAADTVDGPTAADLRVSVLCDTGDAVLGDDEQPCSFPPPAYECPRATFVASGNALCRVTVDVFDAVCTDATTATYELTVTREGAPAALLLTTDDG